MSYSVDFRECVLAYVNSGGSYVSAADIFCVGECTIRRWVYLKKTTGGLSPLPHGGGAQSRVDLELFMDYMTKNPDKTLHEIGKAFGISHQGAVYYLKKLGFVHKKNAALCRKK